jgi:class 3 adenylate cyclase
MAERKLEIKTLFIVMLDISGYTRFTHQHRIANRISVLHAEKIVADLLQAMTQATEHPLILNKIEGDALLFYAEAGDDAPATGREIVRQILACFESFIAELMRLVYCNACTCEACLQAGDLKVKAIVHFDNTVVRDSHGGTEITGEGVILAHRLMKNSLAYDEYILMTPAAREHCGAVEDFREIKGQESYDELGSFKTISYIPPKAETTAKPSGFSLLTTLRGLRYVVALEVYMFKRIILRHSARGKFYNLPGPERSVHGDKSQEN